MRPLGGRCGILVLAGLPLALAACPDPAAAQEAIVVEAAAHQVAIERILEADNLDTATTAASDVAATIMPIPQGRAPDDFWISYRKHVGAWQRFAAVSRDNRSTQEDLLAARSAINATFDDVERIALDYGARMPGPPGPVRPAG